MFKPIELMKTRDWSINLEDDIYGNNPDELLKDSIDAVAATAEGCYVNLVTHRAAGHPEQGLIQKLTAALDEAEIPVQQIHYIDECGCGGFVTRVYR